VKKLGWSLYWALVVIITFSVAFYSLFQIHFQEVRRQIEYTEYPMRYAVELQPGLDSQQVNAISSTILAMKEISSTQLDLPIPEWTGPNTQQPDWERVWKTHLPPVLYATLAWEETVPETVPRVARLIRGVTGVTQVLWDEERVDALVTRLEQWRRTQTFFSLFFFFYMAAIVGGLLSNYPVRLRRHYVVRTGLGGAGSQISPEKVWMQITTMNVLAAVILYALIYGIGSFLFPFAPPSLRGSSPGNGWLEGAMVSGALVAAVCLVGWWAPSEEVDAVTVTRPPALF